MLATAAREASTPTDSPACHIGPRRRSCAQWQRADERRALADEEAHVTLTQRSRYPHRRRAGLAIVAALALIGGACGDDDDDAATDDTTQETTETTEQAAGGEDVAAFCETRVGLEQAFNAEQPDAAAITGLLGDLEASAPSELAANATGLSGVLATAAESGGDPTEDPAFGENIGPIDEFTLTECGYETVAATGVEYSFEGVPETVPAGIVGFELINDGAEPHEMVILRINDGVTGTVEELLALPEEEAMQNLTFVGAAFAEPGQSGATFPELEAGRYAAACFVPVGGGEEGPPHFMQGMMAEFEVA
jgi:hypothetical protein